MKYFYIGLLILALLLAGCVCAGRGLRERTEAAAAPLEQALAALERGDEALGRSLLARAGAEWRRSEGLLACLLNHERTQAVSAALAELEELRGAELTRACGRLIRALRELAETESLRWRNLF
ncbi:MAG: DUF4363 family protein [Oscillospiraceae bacterium]|nr:DUF4363 family protein [Oscillospiraceae bacterium]